MGWIGCFSRFYIVFARRYEKGGAKNIYHTSTTTELSKVSKQTAYLTYIYLHTKQDGTTGLRIALLLPKTMMARAWDGFMGMSIDLTCTENQATFSTIYAWASLEWWWCLLIPWVVSPRLVRHGRSQQPSNTNALFASYDCLLTLF